MWIIELMGELSWEMVIVEDKGIPGGLFSFFRSYERVLGNYHDLLIELMMVSGVWSFCPEYHGHLALCCREEGREC
jgi:hypothetical protein